MGSINLSELVRHMADGVKHITAAERTAWNGKAAGTHSHTKSQITDFPSSLPANGGNADTVDGKHAAAFLPAKSSNVVGADYNTFTATGIYEAQGKTGTGEATKNTPGGNHTNNNFYVLVFNHSSEYITQIATSVRSDKTVYIRSKHAGTWNDWIKIGAGNADTLDGYHASDLISQGVGYVSGAVSRPTSSPYSQTITLGFKPSCIIVMTPPFAVQSNYNTTNAAIIIADSGTVYGWAMSATGDKREITITKTTTGFTAAFGSSSDNGTASLNYVAFK